MSLLCLLLFGVGCFGTGVTTFADAFVIAGGYFHGGGDFNGGWDFHGRLDVGGGLGGNFHVEGGDFHGRSEVAGCTGGCLNGMMSSNVGCSKARWTAWWTIAWAGQALLVLVVGVGGGLCNALLLLELVDVCSGGVCGGTVWSGVICGGWNGGD